MKIIITGCGKIGTTITSCLASEGHDLVCIDDDAEVVNEIVNIYDVMGVCGNGADSDTLTEAGVESAELFIAVTGSDELNMLSCFIARRMGAKHTIARIRNPEYNDEKGLGLMRRELRLSMAINPDLMAAKELENILKFPSAVNVEIFSGRNFEMVQIRLKPNSALDGMSLSEMRKKYDAKFLVCVVQREDEVFIPDGSFVLKSGDKIGLTASPSEIQKLLKMLGILQKQARNVMILGASRTAFYLAKRLLLVGNTVKIIEKDKQKCAEFSNLLPGAMVICGDGASQELLLEEGLETTDAFVALTGMDEENILISIFASTKNVPKVIAKVNRNELASMAEDLGLDCIVSPKKIISDIVTRYARALENTIGSNVENLYKIMDGKAEVLEFSVQSDFEYVNIPLKDMHLKSNILIAGILRGKKIIIPAGDDVIMPGDNVIVLAAGGRMQDLLDIIK